MLTRSRNSEYSGHVNDSEMNLLHRIKLDKLLNVRGKPILTPGPLISIFKMSWPNAEKSLELSTVSIRIPTVLVSKYI